MMETWEEKDPSPQSLTSTSHQWKMKDFNTVSNSINAVVKRKIVFLLCRGISKLECCSNESRLRPKHTRSSFFFRAKLPSSLGLNQQFSRNLTRTPICSKGHILNPSTTLMTHGFIRTVIQSKTPREPPHDLTY